MSTITKGFSRFSNFIIDDLQVFEIQIFCFGNFSSMGHMNFHNSIEQNRLIDTHQNYNELCFQISIESEVKHDLDHLQLIQI